MTPAYPHPRGRDELGAHVSSAGGVQNAPERAAALDSAVLQLFTKTPSRWAEPVLTSDAAARFRRRRRDHAIAHAGAHDSYLINLASPEPALFRRSADSFVAELRRCVRLGMDFLVTHPGNATDAARERGISQNADAITAALERVPGPTRILVEHTAGSGHALGATFPELASLLDRVGSNVRHRVGICLDTCHLFSAGYDIRTDFDGVFREFESHLPLGSIGLFHLNDSATPFASRRDRHAHIGEGSLGDAPFRRLLNDDRFRHVPKIIETPKDGDPIAADLRNLERLRGYRSA